MTDEDPTTLDDTEMDLDTARRIIGELRSEAAGHRTARKTAEEALSAAETRATARGQRLLTETVRRHATGALADPVDLLQFIPASTLVDADGEVVEEAVVAAVAQLVRDRPHLASRRVSGSVDQGQRSDAAGDAFGQLIRDAVSR
jgi:hypothetical protein